MESQLLCLGNGSPMISPSRKQWSCLESLQIRHNRRKEKEKGGEKEEEEETPEKVLKKKS